jgi:membrane peptidoglycan carboxypeptidase
VPSHDETSPVAPRAGSVRRPPPARSRPTGGGGRPTGGSGRPAGGGGSGGARRPAAGSGRARTTAARTASSPGGRGPAGKAPAGKATAGKGAARPKAKARTTKQRRNRRLKIAGAVIAGMLVLLGVFVGVVYAKTKVPSPDSITTAQTTVVYYSDGTTEMARLGDENRTSVSLDEIAEPAQNAVLAAENRSFYTDPGISFTGIVRATWNNLTGGATQGGSTITQQYVKNAILQNDEQTFSRKFQELFLSIKLDNNYSKDQILENYLNTIYYGRGAYGIEAAANTYFGVPAAQLTAQQGAVLAVLIRSPSRYDPEVSPEDAQDRWGRVLDAMVEEGWLTQDERTASTYPPVLPKAGSSLGVPSGPGGIIVNRVIEELQSKHGYTEQQIRAGGLRITTTIDKGYQDAAVAAVADVMDTESKDLRESLVSVDPRTGAIKAYYGGPTDFDYNRAQRQPGSSVKPYVLAAALNQGISVDARRDGSASITFEDRPDKPVRNSGGASCSACTLEEAMTRSLNTTFYGLAYELGPETVRQTILAAADLPETWESGQFNGMKTLANSQGGTSSAIGIGEYEMRPIDQAHGFATFAAGGVERDPYFVARVADNEGTTLLDYAGDQGEQAIEPQVANDVTYALKDVADYSNRSLDDGREVAAKTGTVGSSDESNSDAWMVGYTPSISTAVWMGNDDPTVPIVNVDGGIIYGSGLPGAIWERFMNAVLAGTPEEDLPDEAIIEGDTGEGVPEPEPEPEPVPIPTAPAPAPTTRATPSTPSQKPEEPEIIDTDGDGIPDDEEVPGDENGNGIPDDEEPDPGDPGGGGGGGPLPGRPGDETAGNEIG